MAELTPMMKQYFEIKNKCREYIVFYRLGDFYEMFFEDAKIASRELELTLTGRDCGQAERAPMCGVPYHSYETYVGKLVRKGYKVAICEQVEDPKSSKGLVKREIVRMITPGTLIEASMLDENRNNFLGCIFGGAARCGVCFCDISTGEVFATEVRMDDAYQELFSEFGRFLPREVLLGGTCTAEESLLDFISKRLESIYSSLPDPLFDTDGARERICRQFQLETLEPIGLEELPATLCALGGLLAYLEDTQKASLGSLNTLNVYQQGQYMELDLTARRNLELCETMRGKEKRGSLLWVIDKTKTAMGSRLIRQWLERPLLNPIHIRKRQDAVRALANDVINRDTIMEELKQVFDMERLIGRVVYGSANCRDLCSLQSAMVHLPALYQHTEPFTPPLLQELHNRIDTLTDVALLIETAIQPDPPPNVREGGFIRDGFSKDVDHLRDLASGGKGEIAAIEQRERERTGIKNLKIGYNRVFGYYIEVSKSNIGRVPETYIRKQTLANCERYIMQELKDLENTVLGAQERLIALEYDLFCQVREKIAAQVHRIQRTAQALAHLDVLCSLAQVACENNYVCPDVDFSGCVEIKGGRHPVVEKVLEGSFFVPNDTSIDNKDNRVAIITGPNMAGKSTYMRQVALITIMAQMGSFVPASSAHIGIADRVFTRVGASDDLASGQSTFMVEMNEVADILRYATRNSLLVLDEIGRGTSTYDGMSIARAVIEFVANKRKLGARALFATHYHELTALENLVEGIKNYNIAVKKRGDEITFLRKIVRGGADDSYGIEVAKLAGIPNPVIQRAKEILADLEHHAPKIHMREVAEAEEEPQITMSDLNENAVTQRLRGMQIETMTPIEAMNALFELKKLV
jgi:DNA mismatch repair protein MutS